MFVNLIKTLAVLLILSACASHPSYQADKAAAEKLYLGRVTIPARRGCDICHKLVAEKIVYKYYPVRISHKIHSKQLQIDCTFCHRKALSSTRTDDYLMPAGHGFTAKDGEGLLDENPCRVCHLYSSEKEGGDRLITSKCDKCHPSYTEGKPLSFQWIRFRSNLVNNHKAHYDKGVSCLRCHMGFDQVEKTVSNYVPKMDICKECHGAGGERPKGVAASDAFEEARRIFRRNCAMCHGLEGKGDGPVNAFFRKGLKARDLTSHEYMSKRPEGYIFWVIYDGGPVLGLSERMPAFKGLLSGQEIWMLTKYIRHLSRES